MTVLFLYLKTDTITQTSLIIVFRFIDKSKLKLCENFCH